MWLHTAVYMIGYQQHQITDEKYLSKTLASSKFLDISYTQNYSDRQTETDINLLSVTLHVVLLPPRTAVSWEPQSRTAVVSCM